MEGRKGDSQGHYAQNTARDFSMMTIIKHLKSLIIFLVSRNEENVQGCILITKSNLNETDRNRLERQPKPKNWKSPFENSLSATFSQFCEDYAAMSQAQAIQDSQPWAFHAMDTRSTRQTYSFLSFSQFYRIITNILSVGQFSLVRGEFLTVS